MANASSRSATQSEQAVSELLTGIAEAIIALRSPEFSKDPFGEAEDIEILLRRAEEKFYQTAAGPFPEAPTPEPVSLQGTVNLNGVSDAIIIGTFPSIAEWCVDRFVSDQPYVNDRKNRVWELMREVIALRRLCSGLREDFSPEKA